MNEGYIYQEDTPVYSPINVEVSFVDGSLVECMRVMVTNVYKSATQLVSSPQKLVTVKEVVYECMRRIRKRYKWDYDVAVRDVVVSPARASVWFNDPILSILNIKTEILSISISKHNQINTPDQANTKQPLIIVPGVQNSNNSPTNSTSSLQKSNISTKEKQNRPVCDASITKGLNLASPMNTLNLNVDLEEIQLVHSYQSYIKSPTNIRDNEVGIRDKPIAIDSGLHNIVIDKETSATTLNGVYPNQAASSKGSTIKFSVNPSNKAVNKKKLTNKNKPNKTSNNATSKAKKTMPKNTKEIPNKASAKKEVSKNTKEIPNKASAKKEVSKKASTNNTVTNNTVPHNAPTNNTAPHNAPTNNTVPHNAPTNNTAPHNAPTNNTAPHNAPTNNTVPHNAPTNNTVPHNAPTNNTAPHNAPTNNTVPHNAPTNNTAPHNAPTNNTAPHNAPTNNTVPHNAPTNNTAPHNAPTNNTVPHNAPTNNTVPHNAPTNNTAPHNAPTNNTVPHNAPTNNTVPHNAPTNNTAPHNGVLGGGYLPWGRNSHRYFDPETYMSNPDEAMRRKGRGRDVVDITGGTVPRGWGPNAAKYFDPATYVSSPDGLKRKLLKRITRELSQPSQINQKADSSAGREAKNGEDRCTQAVANSMPQEIDADTLQDRDQISEENKSQPLAISEELQSKAVKSPSKSSQCSFTPKITEQLTISNANSTFDIEEIYNLVELSKHNSVASPKHNPEELSKQLF